MAALTLVGTLLTGCTGGQPVGPVESSPTPGPATTLRVLADTELRNVDPGLLGKLKTETGVELQIDHQNTLAAIQSLTAGDSSYDLAWLPSDQYLSLLRAESGLRHPESQPTMLSPVVLGVRRQVAQSFGWSSGMQVPWADIAARAEAGQLHYAMADPGSSFTGLAALLGIATGAAGTGNALRLEDIREEPLRGFAAGRELPSATSESLADDYVNNQDRLNAIVNYESALLSLNASDKLHEPLELIYPKEGIVTANYPLVLLKDDHREAYRRVLTWLRSDSAQRTLMSDTWRRPVNANVQLDDQFPASPGVEVPFPTDRAVLYELVAVFHDRAREPAHVIFVLDFSGSMCGPAYRRGKCDSQRITELRSVFASLSGADTSISGRLTGFRQREKLTVIRFGSEVLDEREFTVDGPRSAELGQLLDYLGTNSSDDNTAIWTALAHAYDLAGNITAAEPNHLVSIVLMTDGQNNSGITLDEFLNRYANLPTQVRSVRTFTVRFGDADAGELTKTANATLGKYFETNTTSLLDTFKELRGYQ